MPFWHLIYTKQTQKITIMRWIRSADLIFLTSSLSTSEIA
jgi:hypothetical protein